MSKATPYGKFPNEVWDGRTPSTPDIFTQKTPDIEFAARYRAEIIAIENTLAQYLTLLEKIKNYGPGNSILGVKNDGTDLEYKVFEAGDGVTIAQTPGTITISSPGTFAPLYARADVEIEIAQPVYMKANGHLALTDATNSNAAKIIGLSNMDVEATEDCEYFSEGQIEREDWTDITGTEFLTPGLTYFLSDIEAGKLTLIAPSIPGHYVLQVGKAITTTQLDIEITQPIYL